MTNFKTAIGYPLLIVTLVFLLYHSVSQNEFSGLDDLLMIEENWDHLTQFSHIYTAFTEDVFNGTQGTYYRPIQILSYMPDAFIAHSPTPTARIFFIINTILFAFASVLLYAFLKSFNFSANYRLIFTLLFVVHPALTPAVAWVPGRVDIVLFIFVISSIWAFIQYLKTKKKPFYILHLLFFALGMFTKETTIVVPVISLLMALYYTNNISDSKNWKWSNFVQTQLYDAYIKSAFIWAKKHLPIIAGWIGVIAVWFVLRKNALPDNPMGLGGILYQIGTSWEEFIILFGTLLLPLNLQVFLEITWPFIVMGIPGFVLFFGILTKLTNTFKNVFLGLFWIFIFIFPTTLSDYLNYHRLFIPLVGMAFLFAPLDQISNPSMKKFSYLFIGLVGLLFTYENLQFQKAFVHRTGFWQNAVTYSPESAFANNGMAWSYHIDHENDSALHYYERVIQIAPDRKSVRVGMALICEEQGNTQKADSLMQEEFTVTRDSSSVFFYMGQVRLERGDTSQSIVFLQKGIPHIPYSRNARMYYDTLVSPVKSKLDFSVP